MGPKSLLRVRVKKGLIQKNLWAPTAALFFAGAILGISAQEPEWNPANIKECDRECLIDIMDGYMDALFKNDPKALPPLSIDVRMTENTGVMNVGEGVLWRFKVEPTSFKIYVADPVTGQVAQQARLTVGGRDALVAIRLKVDRGKIQEIEQLYDRKIDKAAIQLLTTPLPILVPATASSMISSMNPVEKPPTIT